MRDDTARAVANLAVASAGAAAAYVVLRNPRLRRLAWQATSLWLGASVPAYLLKQIAQAWRDSASPTPVVYRSY